MKAVVIDQYGGVEELHLREVNRPVPGRGQVLIRVRAAGVNPLDWKIRKGMLRGLVRPKFPLILGCDVAGEVEAVGPLCGPFEEGAPVFAMLDARQGAGGYAEFAVAEASATARKPDALSFEEAASIPVAGLTALQALRDLGGLRPGQAVLVNGASGGVGTFAVQIAKALGARVVGVCSASNLELVRQLGAVDAVDYRKEDICRRPEQFDVILDAVANRSFLDCSRILTPRGTYIRTLPSVEQVAWNAFRPALRVLGFGKRARFILAQPRAADLEAMARMADAGKLKPVLESVLPLEDVRDAHQKSESGHARGKIVLRIP